MEKKKHKASLRRAVMQCFCMMLLLSAGLLLRPAMAAEKTAPEVRENGCSITVNMLTSDGNALGGGSMTIYKVAELVSEGGYHFSYVGGFSNLNGNSDYDISGAREIGPALAADLNAYTTLHTNTITPDWDSVAIPESGTLVLDDKLVDGKKVGTGLYLFVQDTAAEGYKTIKPFLVSIPIPDEDGNYPDSSYTVIANPKPGVVEKEPSIIKTVPALHKHVFQANRELNSIPAGEKFVFEFETLNEGPMPVNPDGPVEEGGHVKSVTATKMVLELEGVGVVNIGSITFEQPGEYYYQLKEAGGSGGDYDYDTTTYWIKYTVEAKDNALTCDMKVRYDGPEGNEVTGTDKDDFEFTFKNERFEEDESGSEGESETESESESESESETEELPDESGSEGTEEESETQKQTQPSTGGGNPPTSPTPGGSLPQTGQLWWPVWLLVAVGVLLLGTGILRRRNSRKSGR